ncbi:hypothetical protein REPUB_Repub15cG0029300 [Reevesia pubescens]
MENKKGIVDVSCFLLVEDSGDSELDCEPIKQCQSLEIAAAAAGDHENIDAESCSCDTSYTERLDDFNEVILQLDDEDQDFIDCNEAATSWSSCKMWSIDEALGYLSTDEEAEDHDQEPMFGINNLCRESMDSMEDRLFWETCMAVGYP